MDLDLLRKALNAPGKSQAELARRLGRHPTTVTNILKGKREIKAREIPIIQRYAFGAAGATPNEPSPMPSTADAVAIRELDLRAGLGGGGMPLENFVENGVPADAVSGHWSFPPAYLARELRIRPEDAVIMEVRGDSMTPTLISGDRVIVDSGDRRPSPPGLFALWDGIGVVIKRLDPLHGTEPLQINVISDNQAHSAYAITAEEIHILGRVVWLARRL